MHSRPNLGLASFNRRHHRAGWEFSMSGGVGHQLHQFRVLCIFAFWFEGAKADCQNPRIWGRHLNTQKLEPQNKGLLTVLNSLPAPAEVDGGFKAYLGLFAMILWYWIYCQQLVSTMFQPCFNHVSTMCLCVFLYNLYVKTCIRRERTTLRFSARAHQSVEPLWPGCGELALFANKAMSVLVVFGTP